MVRRRLSLPLALALLLALALPGPARAFDREIFLGDRVVGRLETPVQVDNFRFQGRAGMVIRLRFTADPGMEPAARLEVDNREVWFGGAPGSNVIDSGNLTLDSNNQYLLQLRSANSRAGGYVLETASSDQTLGIGDSSVIVPGQTVGGWLAGPQSGASYQFFGQAGQAVVLSARAGENLTARLTLKSPTGLILWSERSRGPNQPLALPPIRLVETGPYFVFVTAGGGAGGTYELTLNLSQ
ncbi:MAG TPA: hypothetical protein PKD53_27475 [Chloroflexaceae bacterium]|nr:hypothetical protein [Chloroflexaceae bacterium]